MGADKKSLDMRYVVFGPDLNATSNFVVGTNGMIARRGTPQAEWVSKPRANTTRPATQKSKLQAIKPITEKEPASAAQEGEQLAAVECNQMKTAPTNSSFVDLIKIPAFRWTLLYVLLAVLIYCLWPRKEYVSIGHGLILNKRTGEVHRAADRLVK